MSEEIRAFKMQLKPGVVAEYKNYVARDVRLSTAQRVEKQEQATAVQRVDPRPLINIRQPVGRGR